jgi:signal transduction histidine kinase
LSQATRSILYRAVRELLINVAKHAQVDTASVDVECRDGEISVRVADGGVGYEAEAVSSGAQRGLGLISVRERLSLIGGTAEVRSVPGEGTVALLRAPLTVEQPLTGRRGP